MYNNHDSDVCALTKVDLFPPSASLPVTSLREQDEFWRMVNDGFNVFNACHILDTFFSGYG